MRLLLIDASSWFHRAFHALPPLTRPSDNLPVNAVFGFTTMMWGLLYGNDFPGLEPTHAAAVFDHKGRPTHRVALYPAYKANRGPALDDLRVQFPYLRQAATAFGLPIIEQLGYEADDVIATLTRDAVSDGHEVIIVGSDKDLLQLLRFDGVTMLDTMKAKRIGRDQVIERWGVPPEKMVDLQALMGDTADNVPGVPGIGEKTAAGLINQYGDLDNLLHHIDDITQPKRRAALLAHADNARLSRQLCTLIETVALDSGMSAPIDRDFHRLLAFCATMEFPSIAERIAKYAGIELETAPVPEVA